MVAHRIAVNLVVTHTCGHKIAYAYGGRTFAEGDAHNYEGKECSDCRNKAELQKGKTK